MCFVCENVFCLWKELYSSEFCILFSSGNSLFVSLGKYDPNEFHWVRETYFKF